MAMELTHSEPPKQPPLATKQAADVLGIHPNTLRRWEAEGKITATRLPSRQRRWDYLQLIQLRDSGLEA